MAQKPMEFRTINLLQGGADAFVEGSILTGIDPSEGLAWLLHRVEMLFETTQSIISADADLSYSLSRTSQAAIPSYDDDSVIMADGFSNALTTSGEIVLPRLRIWEPPEGVLVVGDTLYAQLDSTGTGMTMQAYMRVYFEEVKVSELEILRILANQA